MQKYVNLTAHICSGYEITLSQRWLQTLSPELQKIVIDGLVEMGRIEDRYQAADEAELQRKLKDKGMTFNPVELAKFQEALRELPNQFKSKWKPGFAEEIKAVR